MLRLRIADGHPLILSALAAEFDVSPDTVRRDLLALEAEGSVQRVRGGALPVLHPMAPLPERQATVGPLADRLATTALALIEDGMVLMLDGGTSVTRLARFLPALPRSLVVTPAPSVALQTLARGIETVLIGGRLSPFGGVAVGYSAERDLSATAADMCILGACGLQAGFGLSADNLDEAAVKRSMVASSHRSVVLAGAGKLGRKARHRVVPCAELDVLVTDALPSDTRELAEAGMEIQHA